MSSLTHPLRFRRHEVLKPWGGRALERCPGIRLREDGAVGETWEVVDRQGEQSVVETGPFEGWTLPGLMKEHRRDLLGTAAPTSQGRFPLLVKYIDAQLNLSVQVHPDETRAGEIGGGAESKTEAWYFLSVERESDSGVAEPKLGRVYAGLRPEVDPDRFSGAAESRAVVDTMHSWDVEAGQSMVVPGGTVHAIGAGVTLLEVQQNSDTTYRVWDWDRVGDDNQPRETHLAEALVAVRYDLPARPPVGRVWEVISDEAERAPMARSKTFGMNALRVHGRSRFSTGNQFQIYAAVEGAGTLCIRESDVEVEVRLGDVWLVPAAAGYHYFEPAGEEFTLIQLLTKP